MRRNDPCTTVTIIDYIPAAVLTTFSVRGWERSLPPEAVELPGRLTVAALSSSAAGLRCARCPTREESHQQDVFCTASWVCVVGGRNGSNMTGTTSPAAVCQIHRCTMIDTSRTWNVKISKGIILDADQSTCASGLLIG